MVCTIWNVNRNKYKQKLQSSTKPAKQTKWIIERLRVRIGNKASNKFVWHQAWVAYVQMRRRFCWMNLHGFMYTYIPIKRYHCLSQPSHRSLTLGLVLNCFLSPFLHQPPKWTLHTHSLSVYSTYIVMYMLYYIAFSKNLILFGEFVFSSKGGFLFLLCCTGGVLWWWCGA